MSDKQPVLPLAAVTVAVVVLAVLAGRAGLAIVNGLFTLVFSVVAIIVMALLGRYLWRRGSI